ncbi:class A sortase [Levilactobacillus brevis]|uniref:class A sortase n=1 Tax=Levilactobacillus brevis TaxID=1580 RepID=UPI00057CBCFF|nr:class A sortase [Levilactobacillus brevis]ANN48444.1 class A sortase [Levilactobacillus brevis]ARN91915.1 class A sortase [Levilactobacillus brevis]ARN94630.1 class A sortase [Levilactobacillus brevis]KID42799.1 Sortase A, LPXTG specific [Levilactobacillus brevis]QCZ42902.1 Sortase (surface protein transpeptidase) [Levilactobacillus brevis]
MAEKKQTPKKHRWRWLWTVLFIFLLAISLALIFNEQIKNWLIASYQPRISRKSVQSNQKKKASYDFSKVKSLDFSTVANARWNTADIHVVGEILMPQSKVHLPIAKGISNEVLALTAGTMRPDQKMGEGNYPLAGHHMTSQTILFSPLYWKTRVGQKIYLTDAKRVYEYQVSVRKFIPATDVQVIAQTKQKLVTLITCDATGANRLMIRGKYVKQMAYKDAPTSVQKGFHGSFNNRS